MSIKDSKASSLFRHRSLGDWAKGRWAILGEARQTQAPLGDSGPVGRLGDRLLSPGANNGRGRNLGESNFKQTAEDRGQEAKSQWAGGLGDWAKGDWANR